MPHDGDYGAMRKRRRKVRLGDVAAAAKAKRELGGGAVGSEPVFRISGASAPKMKMKRKRR